jgi:hypothetical protein
MDDTSARVNGKNYYAHILCNEFYTAYFTRQNKDRMTILEILFQGEEFLEPMGITQILFLVSNDPTMNSRMINY